MSRLPQTIQFGITKDVFAKAAVRDGSDGVLAVMECKSYTFDDLKVKGPAFLLVLENLEKPGNFGALARSADGAGVDAIIVLDPKADIYNPNAIRSSVGALFSQPILTCTHEQFFEYIKKQSIKIVAATPHATNFHHQADLKGSLALVLGSEAWGLSGAWKDAEPIKIPMKGIADSLNVSVAGAIIMYEILRQRS
ncbi:MAG: RNA methyltransferase [Proteobacteria bacterium]|nr:MAG: RNA methyltransferase [Pseudomonadota bacterium]